jgi:hypothetical protein
MVELPDENSVVLRISLALARFLVGAVAGLLVGLWAVSAPYFWWEFAALGVIVLVFGLGGVLLGDRFLARLSRPMDEWQ